MSEDASALEATVREICARHAGQEGALLPILHAVQARLGHISEPAIRAIAQALKLTRAEVFGVVSFYDDFRRRPPARHILRVCRAEACQAQGGRALWAAAEQALAGVAPGQLALEPVLCLGNCACGPSAQLDGRTLGRMSAERVRALVAEAAA
ncbi:MAG TPA: NAD(P)H-dependent oxidoreductase subunit E [Ottowia sp.]|uniref:NAD(P)H-dependent oxidoreductase subunit E n=1 Tax=Ottowia sp. TaxID=1898956 RepID=UPI002B8AFC01|nr:NAD(P)H-dependent oxidoreductase subunit E [Ottowia sp.]HMN20020.1 NAD(P)H-dependent oxidoreductase subunit E [Ottowia sp.]